MKYYYILSLDLEQPYDTDKLLTKLNLAINWLKIVPGTYFIVSSSTYDRWYSRIKSVLPTNRFFIAKLDISNDEYTGWLAKEKWKWIRDNINT